MLYSFDSLVFDDDRKNDEETAKLMINYYVFRNVNPNAIKQMPDDSLQRLSNKLAYKAVLALSPRKNWNISREFVNTWTKTILLNYRDFLNGKTGDRPIYEVSRIIDDQLEIPLQVYADNVYEANVLYTLYLDGLLGFDRFDLEDEIIVISTEPIARDLIDVNKILNIYHKELQI